MQECLFTDIEIEKIIYNLAGQISDDFPNGDKLVLLGIKRRGADLAKRFASILEKRWLHPVQAGSIDINLYRDDWTLFNDRAPHIGKNEIPFQIDNKTVLLFDDVLFSGRTVRAAMEAIMDYGRPEAIKLLILVDRGHRELPICPDYCGETVRTEKNWHIDVLTKEQDGKDAVILTRKD